MHIQNKIVVYTTKVCPYCVKAKALLKSKNVDFVEIDVTGDDDMRAKLVEATGRKTVPQIYIHTTYVGGCDDLYKLKDEGKLDDLLKAVV